MKIIISISFLLFLNACKNEINKVESSNTSSSIPTAIQDDTSAVVADDGDEFKSETSSTQPKAKIVSKKVSGSWPQIAQDIFLKQCMESASFMTSTKAKDYCNCMLNKIQEKFPNLEEAGKMTKGQAHAFSEGCLK
jgi:hypothetical protein